MAKLSTLELRTLALGAEIFRRSSGKTPSIFNREWWSGKMMAWSMRDDAFKVEMFRFVDVFPNLPNAESIARHLKEYFCRPEQDFPTALQWGLKAVSPSSRVAVMVAKTIEKNIHQMAGRFIAGSSPSDALPQLVKMRASNLGFTVDLLGETCVSEAEAIDYQTRYLTLIDTLADAASSWAENPVLDRDHLGAIPAVNVSVKVSALDSQLDPVDFEGSVNRLVERLRPLFERAKARNVFINLDLESYALKDITLETFIRLISEAGFAKSPHAGLVVQAYLRDSVDDTERLLKLAKKKKRPFTVRLVKGAYWDYEVISANQKDWEVPVFQDKVATDANYERITDLILKSRAPVTLAVGSHNVRSIAHAMARAEAAKVPSNGLEFQMLFGMAEPYKQALIEMGYRVRDYAPVGQLVPGMAYLVRRLLENTSNEGFLRSSFVDQGGTEELLACPVPAPLRNNKSQSSPSSPPLQWSGNTPLLDFREGETRRRFQKGLGSFGKKQLGRDVPVVVGGEIRPSTDTMASVYPADPSRVVGVSGLATIADVDDAIAQARQGWTAWAKRPVRERAEILRNAAKSLYKARFSLAHLMVFEVGKSWREADADVCEAVDFLRYYAAEMERLGAGVRMASTMGESNLLQYHPKGLCAVIAPWNFPLAILTGMTAAALVAGNAVLMKPAEQSPTIAYILYQTLIKAGVPSDVCQFLPGVGEVIGPHLVEHPDVDIIAFTGSRAVGLDIVRRAAVIHPGQRHIKRVIVEMGGKNAVIVDEDADLDEAVLGVVRSAFGFQGQKCSACSRAVVVGAAWDAMLTRILEATRSLSVGPPTEPSAKIGPVIDADAQQRILQTIESARVDTELGVQREVPSAGFYVGPSVFVDVDPQHKLAQDEIFGPVLSLIRARDFDHALAIANDTSYALTGGVFTRSPTNIERARRELNVGNVYINRGITGALVGRQPFGGSAMSGVGSKAGGPDYLLQFLDPKTITENTMRRGFSPETVRADSDQK